MESTAMFWTRVAAYNEALWPVQVFMIVVAAVELVRTWKVRRIETGDELRVQQSVTR